MSSVIDALKRLERAGSEDSRSTVKLREAADQLGRHIASLLPRDTILLSRGYGTGEGGTGTPLLTLDLGYDGTTWYGAGACLVSREAACQLASDIATGWLDELAAWLEAQTAESEKCAATLTAAKERLS